MTKRTVNHTSIRSNVPLLLRRFDSPPEPIRPSQAQAVESLAKLSRNGGGKWSVGFSHRFYGAPEHQPGKTTRITLYNKELRRFLTIEELDPRRSADRFSRKKQILRVGSLDRIAPVITIEGLRGRRVGWLRRLASNGKATRDGRWIGDPSQLPAT